MRRHAHLWRPLASKIALRCLVCGLEWPLGRLAAARAAEAEKRFIHGDPRADPDAFPGLLELVHGPAKP